MRCGEHHGDFWNAEGSCNTFIDGADNGSWFMQIGEPFARKA